MQVLPQPSPGPEKPHLWTWMLGRDDGSIEILNMETGARVRTCADETGLHTMGRCGSTMVALSGGLVIEWRGYPSLELISSTPLVTAMAAGERLPPAETITMVVSGDTVVVGGLRHNEVSLLPVHSTAEGPPRWRRVQLTGLSSALVDREEEGKTVTLVGGDQDIVLYSVWHRDGSEASPSGPRLHWAHRQTGFGGCIASLSLPPATILETDGGFTLVSTPHGAVVTRIVSRQNKPRKPKPVAKTKTSKEDESADAPAKGDGKCRKGDRKKRRDGERDLNKEKKGNGKKRGGGS